MGDFLTDDMIQPLRWSSRNRRPNVRYAEYIHTETHGSNNGSEYHDNLPIEEDFGARVLEYIPTQCSLNKGLRIYGEHHEFATKEGIKAIEWYGYVSANWSG